MRNLIYHACFAVVILVFLPSPTCSSQQDVYDKETHRVADAIVTQSGLRLPPDIKDVFALVEWQGGHANCEVIDFKWISGDPDRKEFLTKKKAENLKETQRLEFIRRRTFNSCSTPSYRASPAMFAYFGAIILGVTKDGEIPGIQVDGEEQLDLCYPEFRKHCIQMHGLDEWDTDAHMHLDLVHWTLTLIK